MAVCRTCERVLSANGTCLFCGTLQGMESAGARGRKKTNWVRRILMLLLAALLIHFFFISPTGKGIIKPLLDKVGLGKYLSAD